MGIEIPTPKDVIESTERITEKLDHNDRALFILVLTFLIAIIMIVWFFISGQNTQRDAFLQQIDKQAEVTDRREQRTQASIDKLSDSIDRNTQVMSEVKIKLAH